MHVLVLQFSPYKLHRPKLAQTRFWMFQFKNMGILGKQAKIQILLASIFALVFATTSDAQAIVPALITFGDSALDVGNNNYLPTSYKANYPPYGRDFINHRPTGRFSNGKLVTDITGYLSITMFSPPPSPTTNPSSKFFCFVAFFLSWNSGVYFLSTCIS